jgi:hypothetical protein
MNRIQFFILTGLSIIFILLLVAHVALSISVNTAQAKAVYEQQSIQQAGTLKGYLQQLAGRIYQDGQRTSDPGLKDLLVRQQITYNPPATSTPNTNSTETPAAPPATH